MALFSVGSSFTYHLAPFVLNVITTSIPPQGTVLGPLLFIMYTTLSQHSDLVPSPDYHLLQMTLSSSSLSTHSTNALQQISYCMTTNLLNLNSSKTEFLLIGLKNQLAKIHNSSLDTSHIAWNLGFIFDEHLTFYDQIASISKACYDYIRQLGCIRPYLDSSIKLHVPLLPLSFTPNMTTVILSTINSLSLNYPVCSGSRTFLQVLLKLLSLVISVPSYALSTGSESLNASNTSSSHLPTTLSQLPNLHTFITQFRSTSSQYSLFIRRYSCSATEIILFKK